MQTQCKDHFNIQLMLPKIIIQSISKYSPLLGKGDDLLMNLFRVISQRKVLSLTQWSSKTLPESHSQSTVDQVVWTAVKFISKSTASPSVCLWSCQTSILSLQSAGPFTLCLFLMVFRHPSLSPLPQQKSRVRGVPWNQPPLLQSHTLFFQESPDWLVTAAERGGALLKESECRNPAEFHCFCLLQWNKEEILLCIQSQVEIV